jgi:hypothetical protein
MRVFWPQIYSFLLSCGLSKKLVKTGAGTGQDAYSKLSTSGEGVACLKWCKERRAEWAF